MSKLITTAELATKSVPELRSLFRTTFNDLARSESGSIERRNALASLENISNALAHATVCSPKI